MVARLIKGDCLAAMREMHAQGERVDAIVTDPPYHLKSIVERFGKPGSAPAQFGTDGSYARHSRGFMGKEWDGGDIAFQVETWRLAYDVLKPGGYLIAMAGTRTYHRMVCAIEDAGFDIRDQIGWCYGQGMPKSLDVSKAIDDHFFHEWLDAHPLQQLRLKCVKGDARTALEADLRRESGFERKVVGESHYAARRSKIRFTGLYRDSSDDPEYDGPLGRTAITAPATPEAAQWEGWGTALKPSWEPICVARRPLGEPTVAANVLVHGTGGINVDACRIEHDEPLKLTERTSARFSGLVFNGGKPGGLNLNIASPSQLGRWPANLVHDGSDEVMEAFAAFGELRARGNKTPTKRRQSDGIWAANGALYGIGPDGPTDPGDTGTAARFFYSAKASKAERAGSKHPTVKPVALMRWLVTLVTPSGGTVLDMFAGSGTTLQAAIEAGFHAIGIEKEPEYQADIERRLATCGAISAYNDQMSDELSQVGDHDGGQG